MYQTTVQVFVAVALGAFFGALAGLGLADKFGWQPVLALPLSMIIGGFVGYLVYDFKTVVQTTPKAAQMAWRQVIAMYSWRPSRLTRAKMVVALRLLPYAFMVNLMLFGYLGSLLVGLPMLLSSDINPKTLLLSIFSLTFGFAFLGSLWQVSMTVSAMSNLKKLVAFYKKEKKGFIVTMREANPFKGFYWILWALWYALRYWIGPATLFSVSWTKWFFIFLFREIHSDLRLLCMTDAAIFAGIGFLMGNIQGAAMSALIGGLFGIVNYQIISVRWLKLAPAKKRA